MKHSVASDGVLDASTPELSHTGISTFDTRFLYKKKGGKFSRTFPFGNFGFGQENDETF